MGYGQVAMYVKRCGVSLWYAVAGVVCMALAVPLTILLLPFLIFNEDDDGFFELLGCSGHLLFGFGARCLTRPFELWGLAEPRRVHWYDP